MSAPRVPVALVGAAGRLGSLARTVIEDSAEFELVAAYGSRDDWRAAVGSSGARVALEATRAGLGFEHARALLEAGVRPLVATSGVDPEAARTLDGLARAAGLGGLVVPNFSLGSLLLQRFCEQAAAHFPDAEIVEGHHPRKHDAPSGTARETARRIARARGAAPPAGGGAEPRARGEVVDGVPVHALRLPGLYAEQEVVFGAPGEGLRILHRMDGPAAFGPGILAGLRHAARADGVAHGLEHALA